MKAVYSLLLCLVTVSSLAQIPKPLSSQQSKIELKGNNNTVKVIQAGTVITYNLLDEQEQQQFLGYLRSLPSFQKQLGQLSLNVDKTKQTVSRVEQRQKNQDKLLLEIAKNTVKEGFISLDACNKGLESYVLKNKQLEEELAKLKAQNQNTEFASVLAQAEEKLKQLDNEGYQQILEIFKQERKAKLQQQQEEYTQAAYLQAQNSYNQFQFKKALQQLEEAWQYPTKHRTGYLVLKADILRDSYRLDEAIEVYQMLSSQGLDDTLRGRVYNNLGLAYASKGEYEKAIEYHTKVLAINLKMLGSDHPLVATSYNNLGLDLLHLTGDGF